MSIRFNEFSGVIVDAFKASTITEVVVIESGKW